MNSRSLRTPYRYASASLFVMALVSLLPGPWGTAHAALQARKNTNTAQTQPAPQTEQVTPVPALGPFGLALMSLLAGGLGCGWLRRQR